jgi:hypothetical protein
MGWPSTTQDNPTVSVEESHPREFERGCALEIFNGHDFPEENLDDK